MEWGPIVAGGVAGLGTGVVGSLIAPWVQLAVERRRDQRHRRLELIDQWRRLVAQHHQPGHIDSDGLVDDPGFQTLRSHLSPSARRSLETQTGSSAKPLEIREAATGITANADLDLVTQEIDRLEREWGLT